MAGIEYATGKKVISAKLKVLTAIIVGLSVATLVYTYLGQMAGGSAVVGSLVAVGFMLAESSEAKGYLHGLKPSKALG